MKRHDFKINEKVLADALRDELFSVSHADNKKTTKNVLPEMETISSSEKSYVSPIFSMNEDEILAFVEEFNVGELATLSTAELNHIGKVLGVDPKILVEGED